MLAKTHFRNDGTETKSQSCNNERTKVETENRNNGGGLGPAPQHREPKQDPQAVGSAVSYARRYSLMSWLGIPQADDDAELAMPERKTTKKKAKATPKHAAATKALNATKSMDELKSIWVTFDEATRTALTDLKNELKDKFDESAYQGTS